MFKQRTTKTPSRKPKKKVKSDVPIKDTISVTINNTTDISKEKQEETSNNITKRFLDIMNTAIIDKKSLIKDKKYNKKDSIRYIMEGNKLKKAKDSDTKGIILVHFN